jgi:hypothetical protein
MAERNAEMLKAEDRGQRKSIGFGLARVVE